MTTPPPPARALQAAAQTAKLAAVLLHLLQNQASRQDDGNNKTDDDDTKIYMKHHYYGVSVAEARRLPGMYADRHAPWLSCPSPLNAADHEHGRFPRWRYTSPWLAHIPSHLMEAARLAGQRPYYKRDGSVAGSYPAASWDELACETHHAEPVGV